MHRTPAGGLCHRPGPYRGGPRKAAGPKGQETNVLNETGNIHHSPGPPWSLEGAAPNLTRQECRRLLGALVSLKGAIL